jgi:hypothetical protein
VRCNDETGKLMRIASSSRRYKNGIADICNSDLNPEKLYDLPVRQYMYNAGYLDNSDKRYNKYVCGFIAEEVNEIYPIATEYRDSGLVESWNERYIIPPMLALIQMQKKQLEQQKTEILSLQGELSIIKTKLSKAGGL